MSPLAEVDVECEAGGVEAKKDGEGQAERVCCHGPQEHLPKAGSPLLYHNMVYNNSDANIHFYDYTYLNIIFTLHQTGMTGRRF